MDASWALKGLTKGSCEVLSIPTSGGENCMLALGTPAAPHLPNQYSVQTACSHVIQGTCSGRDLGPVVACWALKGLTKVSCEVLSIHTSRGEDCMLALGTPTATAVLESVQTAYSLV